MLARTSAAIQSRPILLTSIRITPRLQVCHQGDVRHHVSPCRTAVSCPSIMSVGDIQAWCDVAFTKGHVRHLCFICISKTGSRHMGVGFGHYTGPGGGLMLWGFVSRILIPGHSSSNRLWLVQAVDGTFAVNSGEAETRHAVSLG